MALSLDDSRRAYAEDIRAVSDIRCEALIEALARVPREDFLGPGPWLVLRQPLSASLLRDTSQESIYRLTRDADPRQLCHNILIAIDPERGLNNGQPAANLFWLDSLDLRGGDRVVHVGCGVGYYTAILAEAVSPTGSVLAIECDEGLAARSRANLRAWPHVNVVTGDGATFELGEFDLAYINAGATRLMPRWLAGLRPGGRLLVPLTVDAPPAGGYTLLVTRTGERWSARFTGMVAIYSCYGARDTTSGDALRELYKQPIVRDVQSLRRDPHEREATCAMHLDDYCLSTLPPDPLDVPR